MCDRYDPAVPGEQIADQPDDPAPDEQADERNGWWRGGLRVVGPFVPLFFRVRVEGTEQMPRSGPAVLIFNHVSVLDGPVLAIETSRRTRRAVRFLVAAEIFRKPVLGWILRRYQQIPIRRGEGDAAALDAAIATVREGALAAIAPEGRVNDDGVTELQRVRSGVARIALPAGAPVVPAGIWGTNRTWPRSGLRLRARRPVLAIAFGTPVVPERGEDVEAFLPRVRVSLQRQADRARELSALPPTGRVSPARRR